jgi:hypothetical protein
MKNLAEEAPIQMILIATLVVNILHQLHHLHSRIFTAINVPLRDSK